MHKQLQFFFPSKKNFLVSKLIFLLIFQTPLMPTGNNPWYNAKD